jgi:hypothetical protein
MNSALLTASGNEIVELRYRMRSEADTGWVYNIQHMVRKITYISQILFEMLLLAPSTIIRVYTVSILGRFRKGVTFLSVRKHGTSYSDKIIS